MMRSFVVLAVLTALVAAALVAQTPPSTLRFPITVSDSGAVVKTYTLHVGLHPKATVCLDTAVFTGFEFCGAADTAHVREIESPPDPPSGCFRFSPYNNLVCTINLWKDDIRKFTDTTQIDTFKVLLKTEPDLVDTHAVTYSWPACVAAAADSMILQQRIVNPPGAYRINMALQSSFTLRVSTGGINSQLTVNAFLIIKGPRPNRVVAVDDRSPLVPAAFGLGQNYPNPFNPSTRIAYDVARAGHVNLTVFNLLGEPVAVLVDADESPGAKTVTWDAADAPAGIYFYSLSTPGGRFVKKMLLIR